MVAFLGARDYYQSALALAEEGRLARLITDLYCPDAFLPWGARLPGPLRDRVLARRSMALSSSLVSPSLLRGMSRGALHRVTRETQKEVDHSLGLRAAYAALEGGYGGLVYSYYWQGFLDGLSRRPPGLRLLFQVHPVPSQVRRALGRDRAITGGREDLEPEELLSPGQVQRQEEALLEADGVIAPSSYVRDGLVDVGVSPERIKVVPYGGELEARTGGGPTEVADGTGAIEGKFGLDGPLRLLWVGSPSYRKGFHHLLRAMCSLTPKDVTLTVVARSRSDAFSVPLEIEPRVTFLNRQSPEALGQLYANHHALVMPSLVEGFGLVYLEALAHGVPIIATPNSGAPDVMVAGREGEIVPPGDWLALANVLAGLADDPNRAARMRTPAREVGRTYTWARFRDCLRRAVFQLEAQALG